MLQAKVDDEMRRRFNPDRDLVWMLPRIIKRALMTFGNISSADLKEALVKGGFDDCGEAVDTADIEDFKEFLGRLTDFLGAAATQHDEPKTSDEFVRAKLADLYELPAAIRLLVFDRVMKVIMAEFRVWCDQVRPESEKDPRVPVDEVEAAVGEILEQLSS